ncbi:SPOR domain-containing protein [Balneolaceae bacterium YR4-1]|uniref:SPOR domain-containing protein n=1 Tax=Halalkalibaculum roseum TaxID=2709311 RepID=A0A6M1SR17_9BACT|nr:SPOR domain-containing protein [Halalkalibaculum roseum]NGP75260.1 SPOR domain-containing protein [Halalkalibaculum roseum]
MRQFIFFSITAVTLISLMSACGPSEEEIQQREQARQDSLEQVRQQRMEQQRMDSIAQAREDSIAAVKKKQERRQISFNTSGNFSLQVEAWRSQEKAQAQVQKWKDRGFENAYVVKYGQEETGNIWFRVRLGLTDTRERAEQLGQNLAEEYNTEYWISQVEGAN